MTGRYSLPLKAAYREPSGFIAGAAEIFPAGGVLVFIMKGLLIQLYLKTV